MTSKTKLRYDALDIGSPARVVRRKFTHAELATRLLESPKHWANRRVAVHRSDKWFKLSEHPHFELDDDPGTPPWYIDVPRNHYEKIRDVIQEMPLNTVRSYVDELYYPHQAAVICFVDPRKVLQLIWALGTHTATRLEHILAMQVSLPTWYLLIPMLSGSRRPLGAIVPSNRCLDIAHKLQGLKTLDVDPVIRENVSAFTSRKRCDKAIHVHGMGRISNELSWSATEELARLQYVTTMGDWATAEKRQQGQREEQR